jgi:hypothetical protein
MNNDSKAVGDDVKSANFGTKTARGVQKLWTMRQKLRTLSHCPQFLRQKLRTTKQKLRTSDKNRRR